MMEQMERLSEAFLAARATRVASVKASLTPRFFMAEHSAAASQQWPQSSLGEQHTQIPQRLDVLGRLQPLLVFDHRSLGFVRILVLVVLGLAQVALEGHEDDLDAGAVLLDFRFPLGLDVLEGLKGVDLVIVR